MTTFVVTRAHLRTACDQEHWDLLDKLLELDASLIDDNALFTDEWGLWWGMLYEVAKRGAADGVRVLLKHGAKRQVGSWGDGLALTPLEVAEGKPEIERLLRDGARPRYLRQTDPPWPAGFSAEEEAVNKQGVVRDATGLVFQPVVWRTGGE